MSKSKQLSTSGMGHSIQTDNAKLSEKVYLRKAATNHLKNLKVLDLFAGENVLWSYFQCSRYYGVEQQKGKGKNLYADNRKVIPTIDLSGFNVIDIDSYGIPFEQVEQIFRNDTLKKGTVIVYTCIGNSISSIGNAAIRHFGIEEMYKEAPTLFNGYGREYFHAMLYENGIRTITVYRPERTSFDKEYGYFIV